MKSFQLKKEETHIKDFFSKERNMKFSAYCGFSWELIFLKNLILIKYHIKLVNICLQTCSRMFESVR